MKSKCLRISFRASACRTPRLKVADRMPPPESASPVHGNSGPTPRRAIRPSLSAFLSALISCAWASRVKYFFVDKYDQYAATCAPWSSEFMIAIRARRNNERHSLNDCSLIKMQSMSSLIMSSPTRDCCVLERRRRHGRRSAGPRDNSSAQGTSAAGFSRMSSLDLPREAGRTSSGA